MAVFILAEAVGEIAPVIVNQARSVQRQRGELRQAGRADFGAFLLVDHSCLLRGITCVTVQMNCFATKAYTVLWLKAIFTSVCSGCIAEQYIDSGILASR